jgi:hypothetical protein
MAAPFAYGASSGAADAGDPDSPAAIRYSMGILNPALAWREHPPTAIPWIFKGLPEKALYESPTILFPR